MAVDIAVLVVAAADGLTAQDREQVRLTRRIGVPHIVAFLDGCDLVDDGEQLDRVESEVRELLSANGLPGDDAPVIRGSVAKAVEGDAEWEAKITELAGALDAVPAPVRAVDKPFLLAVEEVFGTDRGTVIVGRCRRGVIKVGDEVELVGIKETRKVTCTGIEMGRNTLDEARAGEKVGLLVSGVRREDVELGQVLAAPGSIAPRTRFEAEVYFLDGYEGGRSQPITKGFRPQFYFRSTDITGDIELPDGVEALRPGDTGRLTVTLTHPVALDQGLRFAIREGGRTVGAGVVTEVLG